MMEGEENRNDVGEDEQAAIGDDGANDTRSPEVDTSNNNENGERKEEGEEESGGKEDTSSVVEPRSEEDVHVPEENDIELRREIAIVKREMNWQNKQLEAWKKRRTVLKWKDGDRDLRIKLAEQNVENEREKEESARYLRRKERKEVEVKRQENIEERERRRHEMELIRLRNMKNNAKGRKDAVETSRSEALKKQKEEFERRLEAIDEKKKRTKMLEETRAMALELKVLERRKREVEIHTKWKEEQRAKEEKESEYLRKLMAEKKTYHANAAGDHESSFSKSELMNQKRNDSTTERERQRVQREMGRLDELRQRDE